MAYAPAIIWATALLSIGGRSDVPTVDTPLPLDKAAHFLLYGLLGALAVFGWRRADKWPPLYLPVLLAITVGAADELNQRGVSGRSAEWLDWCADTLGVVAGSWVVLRIVKENGNAD